MLTYRERQVMDLYTAGQLDTQIARTLGLSNGRIAQLRRTAAVKLYRHWRETFRLTHVGADAARRWKPVQLKLFAAPLNSEC